METPAPPLPENVLPLVVLIVMMILAVSGAPQKFKAFLIIIARMAAGVALGLLIGLAFGSQAAAGMAAGIGMLVMGVGASWQRLRRNKKSLP